jgi:hypothetical protein
MKIFTETIAVSTGGCAVDHRVRANPERAYRPDFDGVRGVGHAVVGGPIS